MTVSGPERAAADGPPARQASTGPLRAVLAAFDSGTSTLDGIARQTGLDADVVSAAVQHLLRAGLLEGRTLTAGCPTGGCRSCASGHGAEPGCGSAGPDPQRSGPVLVALSRRCGAQVTAGTAAPGADPGGPRRRWFRRAGDPARPGRDTGTSTTG